MMQGMPKKCIGKKIYYFYPKKMFERNEKKKGRRQLPSTQCVPATFFEQVLVSYLSL